MQELFTGLINRHGRLPQLTLGLIIACVAVALFTNLGADIPRLLPFLMSEYRGNQLSQLVQIQQGEYWRLITPILAHFGLLHLLFNMMWLWDLGGTIEVRWSPLRLALLTVVIAVSSNLAQYLVSGALFGGMSGVVFGLLAYLYVIGRLQPQTGVFVPPQIMAFMLIWFAICWTGLAGNIANWAHLAGLVAGALLALLPVENH